MPLGLFITPQSLFPYSIVVASRSTNRREFVLRELSPLLEATLSKKDEDETIRRLPLEDARILVDAIDEVRTNFPCRYELRN